MKLIQDELQKVTESIQSCLGLDNLTFYYSTVNEFMNLLANKKTPKLKYPFLFVNSVGVHYKDTPTDTIVIVPDIVIATYSSIKWNAQERDKQSFKPVLLPIYNEFLTLLTRVQGIEITQYGDRYDHYFYGKTGLVGYEQDEYPDHVDAIQLKNFQFRLTNNNNCKK